MTDTDTSLARSGHTRWATRTQFFCAGFIFATWGVHIPTVKAHYGVDDAELGMAMLAAGIFVQLSDQDGRRAPRPEPEVQE